MRAWLAPAANWAWSLVIKWTIIHLWERNKVRGGGGGTGQGEGRTGAWTLWKGLEIPFRKREREWEWTCQQMVLCQVNHLIQYLWSHSAFPASNRTKLFQHHDVHGAVDVMPLSKQPPVIVILKLLVNTKGRPFSVAVVAFVPLFDWSLYSTG